MGDFYPNNNFKRNNDTKDNFIKFCLIIIDTILIIWYNKYRISKKLYKIGCIHKTINFSYDNIFHVIENHKNPFLILVVFNPFDL